MKILFMILMVLVDYFLIIHVRIAYCFQVSYFCAKKKKLFQDNFTRTHTFETHMQHIYTYSLLLNSSITNMVDLSLHLGRKFVSWNVVGGGC